jgi:hypothetical protein
LLPVAPSFASSPPATATQGELYAYQPLFNGTPPSLTLISGPEGMELDTIHWSIRWTPTNQQALSVLHPVRLRSENGAGQTEQRFVITVSNVNDPPLAASLVSPPDSGTMSFTGSDPAVVFRWASAGDPDGDRVTHLLQVDTISTFTSPFRRDTLVQEGDSVRLVLQKATREYFWRTLTSDGEYHTVSTPAHRKFTILYASPAPVVAERPHVTVEPPPAVDEMIDGSSVKYVLQRSGHVRLSVWNLLGQEVATVVDAVQNSGSYELDLARSALPDGIYIYRLQGPGFFETRKLVISR